MNQLLKLRQCICNKNNSLTCCSRFYSQRDVGNRKFYELSLDEEEEERRNRPNPLIDIETRMTESKQRMQWRPHVSRRTSFLTEGLSMLAPDRKRFQILHKFTQSYDTFAEYVAAIGHKKELLEASQQIFVKDRHRICGNDLGAAHFLVSRGGKVRFTISSEWVTKDQYTDLPNKYHPDWMVDAILCDDMNLYYEGLANVRRLNYLKYISFRNVKRFDNWSMDRFCGNEFDSLEIMDITGTSVTSNGLSAIFKLPSLRLLVVDDRKRSPEFELTILEMEITRPSLRIVDSKDFDSEAIKLKSGDEISQIQAV